MSNATITGKVTAVKRHGHTPYGNPTMSITLDTSGPLVWWRISDNAGIVYGIENSEYREIPHVLNVNKSGRLSGMARPANAAEIAALSNGADADARRIHNERFERSAR